MRGARSPLRPPRLAGMWGCGCPCSPSPAQLRRSLRGSGRLRLWERFSSLHYGCELGLPSHVFETPSQKTTSPLLLSAQTGSPAWRELALQGSGCWLVGRPWHPAGSLLSPGVTGHSPDPRVVSAGGAPSSSTCGRGLGNNTTAFLRHRKLVSRVMGARISLPWGRDTGQPPKSA